MLPPLAAGSQYCANFPVNKTTAFGGSEGVERAGRQQAQGQQATFTSSSQFEGSRHTTQKPNFPASPSAAATLDCSRQEEKDWETRLRNENSFTWHKLGLLCKNAGDTQRAVECFSKSLAFNSKQEESRLEISEALKGLKRYQQAIESYEQVLQLNQQSVVAWKGIGECYSHLGHSAKALSAFERALSLPASAKEPFLWFSIGLLYDTYGSRSYAEEIFSAILKSHPEFEKRQELLVRCAMINKHQQKYEKALEYLSCALDVVPSFVGAAEILFNAGQIFESLQMPERAKELYSRILQHSPTSPQILRQLGCLFSSQNDHSAMNQAISYFNKALQLDSSDARTWSFLGRCYCKLKEFEKAFHAYKEASYRNPKDPEVWHLIGLFYSQVNQFQDALDSFRKATQIDPTRSDIWFDVGLVYERSNQLQDCISAYSKALELDPNNTQVQQKVYLLKQSFNKGGGSHQHNSSFQYPAQHPSRKVHYPSEEVDASNNKIILKENLPNQLRPVSSSPSSSAFPSLSTTSCVAPENSSSKSPSSSSSIFQIFQSLRPVSSTDDVVNMPTRDYSVHSLLSF
eukprot:TRINITY_DN5164_c0_g1_i1.p1 TRINITY_DN5164_c0_g1~~TRINITY_DN5164_c0_g1_i1.p1  ORF type:complete len:573 (-),score=95.02 TRINITY_DN5164_c0_g1_i1:94-1812(-)